MAFDLETYNRLMALIQNQSKVPGLAPIPMSQDQPMPPPMPQQTASPNVPQPGLVPSTKDTMWGKAKELLGDGTGADNIKYMIPAMALSQFGAALMAPPEQRGAIMSQLPANIQRLQITQEEARNRRTMARLYERIYGGKTAANTFDKEWWTDQTTGESRQFPPGGPVPRGYVRSKAPEPKEYKPIVRSMRIGTDQVTQQYNPDTGQWDEIARGPAFNPKESQNVTFVEPQPGQVYPPGTKPMPKPDKADKPYRMGFTTNEKGEQVPAKINTITGEVTPISPFGKAVPGKKPRIQIPVIPGVPPEAGGTLPPTMKGGINVNIPPGTTAGPGQVSSPSQSDLEQYQRVLKANVGNPEKIKAIQQKAMGAWGYIP